MASTESGNDKNNSNNKNNKNVDQKDVEATKKALDSFKSDIIERTTVMIKEYLPIKIVQLTALFDEIDAKQTDIERLKFEGSDTVEPSPAAASPPVVPDVKMNGVEPPAKPVTATNKNKKKRSFNEMAFDDKDNKNKNARKNPKDANISKKTDAAGRQSQKETQLKCNGHCQRNEEIERFIVIVKKEVEELIDYLDQINIFINLHTPKIEDGNNFGVEIQENMKSMVSTGQLSAQDFLRNIPKWHTLRAKLISKVMKYPNLADYQKSIIELDYKQMLTLKHCLRDLRNNYLVLYDVLTKNWDRIVKPKGDKNITFQIY